MRTLIGTILLCFVGFYPGGDVPPRIRSCSFAGTPDGGAHVVMRFGHAMQPTLIQTRAEFIVAGPAGGYEPSFGFVTADGILLLYVPMLNCLEPVSVSYSGRCLVTACGRPLAAFDDYPARRIGKCE